MHVQILFYYSKRPKIQNKHNYIKSYFKKSKTTYGPKYEPKLRQEKLNIFWVFYCKSISDIELSPFSLLLLSNICTLCICLLRTLFCLLSSRLNIKYLINVFVTTSFWIIIFRNLFLNRFLFVLAFL